MDLHSSPATSPIKRILPELPLIFQLDSSLGQESVKSHDICSFQQDILRTSTPTVSKKSNSLHRIESDLSFITSEDSKPKIWDDLFSSNTCSWENDMVLSDFLHQLDSSDGQGSVRSHDICSTEHNILRNSTASRKRVNDQTYEDLGSENSYSLPSYESDLSFITSDDSEPMIWDDLMSGNIRSWENDMVLSDFAKLHQLDGILAEFEHRTSPKVPPPPSPIKSEEDWTFDSSHSLCELSIIRGPDLRASVKRKLFDGTQPKGKRLKKI